MEHIKHKASNDNHKAAFPMIIWGVMALWTLLFIVMFAWAIVQSNKSIINFFMDAVGLPAKEYGGWQFGNWTKVFSDLKVRINSGRWVYFTELVYNTLFYIFVYAFVRIAGPTITSYVYAKYSKRVKFTKIAWWLMLVGTYVPISASLAASLNLAMNLRIYDNLYLFSIASFGGFGGGFLIYYAVWKGLSWDYAEAAFIDGAGHAGVFFKIMFPMTTTIFGVLFLTNMIALYADYYTPMVFLPSYPTLSYAVFLFQSSVESGVSIPIKIASLIVVALPMLVIFLVFKDKMMGSLTVGGLKG